MKIEFSTIGDGTNIQVTLYEELGGTDSIVDRCYTADHRGGIYYGEDQRISVSAWRLFEWVEDSWLPPVIGGKYGAQHPYWQERLEKRQRRAAQEASDAK